jgi:hypothetical protein
MSPLYYIKFSIRDMIAGLILLVASLPVHAGSPAQSPENALRDATGVWSTDNEGRWMFCVYVTDVTGTGLVAAKCFEVPGAVTATRDAHFKN